MTQPTRDTRQPPLTILSINRSPSQRMSRKICCPINFNKWENSTLGFQTLDFFNNPSYFGEVFILPIQKANDLCCIHFHTNRVRWRVQSQTMEQNCFRLQKLDASTILELKIQKQKKQEKKKAQLLKSEYC